MRNNDGVWGMMGGEVKGFEKFTVLVEREGKEEVIYKHAMWRFGREKKVELELE